jgi:hypothetical protein
MCILRHFPVDLDSVPALFAGPVAVVFKVSYMLQKEKKLSKRFNPLTRTGSEKIQ